MRNSPTRKFSILLAGLFTIAMVFATIVVPRKLHPVVSSVISKGTITSFPPSGFLWYIGAIALCLLVILIVAGFILEKTQLASCGSFLLYLPTLSYFALTMFYLYGIGFLRVLWLPVIDFFGYDLFSNIGQLVYLPLLILILLIRLVSWVIGMEFDMIGMIIWYGIAYGLISVGSFVFFLGTEAWLYGKQTEQAVIDSGVYRYSRHPQYLGFLLWSYGGSFAVGSVTGGIIGYLNPGFPWVVSVLLVVCVALFEEQTMIEEYDEAYQAYRENTPFLLPLPSFLAKLVTGPMQLLLGKNYTTEKREIAYVFFLYLGLYLLAAFLFHYLMLALLGIM